METMTIVRRDNSAEAWLDAGRSDRSRTVKAARIALGGSTLDRTPLDPSRGGAGVLRFECAAVPEIAAPGLRRRENRCRAVLAVAALHWAAVASLALPFVAAVVSVWLGPG